LTSPAPDDAASYLTSHGLQVFRASGAEVTVHCPFCLDGDAKGKGKCYVNTESWLYECKRCGERGNRKTLLRHFGDTDTVEYLPGSDPMARRRVLEEYADTAADLLSNNESMMLYLLGRGLSAETIIEARLGYVPLNYGICDSLPHQHKKADLIASGMLTSSGREYFSDRITIPYLSRGSVLSVRGKDVHGKYFTATGDAVRLYGADDLYDEVDDVVVVEGEFDALILRQHLAMSTDPRLRRTAVIGLPGAGATPSSMVDMLSGAKRIYLALDPDETGRTSALKLKDTLGSRARIVELPEALPKCDWTEYLRPLTPEHPHGGHGWRDVADLLSAASGRRIFSVREAGAAWGKLRTDQPGIKLGFHELDATLKPGLMPGQVMIPLAKTGTGKTLLLCNIAYNTRSRRCLIVSLEMTAPEVFNLLQRIYRFWHPFASPHQMHEDLALIRIVDENRLNEKDIAALVEEYTEEVGGAPELLMIDYLGYLARGMRGGDSYERTSAAAMEVKAIAKRVGAAVIAPHQVNRGAQEGKPLQADDARDSGVIEETGDFVLSLFKPDEAVDAAAGQPGMVTGAMSLGVLKSRHGGKGRVFNLRYSAASLVIVDSSNRKAVIKVDQENARINQGEHYEDIIASQSQTQLVLVGA
jgi:hypothetical protein